MKIETTRFGSQEVEQDTIIHFPNGLLNNPQTKEFKLFHKDDANPVAESQPNPVIYWLQSVDDPDQAYTIVDPSLVGFSYNVSLPDEDYKLMNSQETDEIAMMVVITGTEKEESSNNQEGFNLISGSMTEPLFINLNSKKAIQRSIKPLDYDIFLTIPV